MKIIELLIRFALELTMMVIKLAVQAASAIIGGLWGLLLTLLHHRIEKPVTDRPQKGFGQRPARYRQHKRRGRAWR